MSLVQPVDWVAVAAPLAVALLAMALLVADLFLSVRHRWALGWIAVGGLLAAAALVLPLVGGDGRGTFCFPSASGGAPVCSYEADRFAVVLQLFVLLSAAVVALISMRTVAGEVLPAGEYWFLLLCSVCGALVLVAARDLLTLVVALEVVTLPTFALVALRRDDQRSSEAALKLFLVSVVSTALTLYGISVLYGATGAVHVRDVARVLGAEGSEPFVAAGAILTAGGFAFKVAAVPFHTWVPEVYAGAPLPVAAYLSVVSKGAGFAGLIVVLHQALGQYAASWAPVLGVVAVLTMTAGNVAALRQRDAVRLLGWSSVAQSGYLLVPFAAEATAPGAGVLVATVPYLLAYAVMNLAAFAAVAHAGLSRLEEYDGLAWTRPRTALALAFALVCLAGLPPGLMGLFAKLVVFRSPVAAGNGWLAVVLAVNVVVGLAYYLAWAARLVRRTGAAPAGSAGTDAMPRQYTGVRASAIAVAVTAATAVVLSVAPSAFLGVLAVR